MKDNNTFRLVGWLVGYSTSPERLIYHVPLFPLQPVMHGVRNTMGGHLILTRGIAGLTPLGSLSYIKG